MARLRPIGQSPALASPHILQRPCAHLPAKGLHADGGVARRNLASTFFCP